MAVALMPAENLPSAPARSLRVTLVTLTLAVFAAVVAFVTWQLRGELRAQVLQREGEALASVASMQLGNSAAELAKLGLTDVPGELADVALKTSKLRGVLGIRVFDAEKKLVESAPWVWSEDAPPAADWARLAANEPLARLHAAPQPALAGLVTDTSVPLLEAWVPLARADTRALAGAAQFWIDGRGVAAEFARLDRRLAVQAGLAWLAGAVVIALALGWAFRRLAAANAALAARTEDLSRANRELVLAAKTSALGAVTAHLIHEIKNPIAGLESFVASQAENGARGDAGAEQAAATELTRRLRTMINDVVAVLHDEQHGAKFELTCAEIAEHVLGQTQSAATAAGVELTAAIAAKNSLPGRRANLAGLVLRNLLQNAIEASARGGVVKLASRELADGTVEFSVEDSGTGLVDAVRARLFQPCASTKRGGSGLGLVLSQQLAQQAGGRIELVRSDAHGTCFRLALSVGE
jgi:signal transduction histidine kinase